MNKYIKRFRTWFEARNLREKMLVIVCSWALLYALFEVVLYYHVDAETASTVEKIKKTQDKIAGWQVQLKYLKEIPSTPIYKEWIARRQSYEALKNKYKNLLGTPSVARWEEIIKTVLSSYPNITIAKIANAQESVFQTTKIQSETESIYQHQMTLTVLGNYADVVDYLLYLEKTLPNIHWDTLTYTVKQYPTGEVAMEFSILYEKSAL